ncbi:MULTISPECIES: hypothetical protein [Kitasatospora]|uniref:Uncharacterized protein n=1 Tax=Kitasatospora cathayae TaxID=3004092 RepID=A0ABY7QER5_9ACTN|nr:hypothetical protein [Kitasatospora sp. HUAS 3-15]WBP90889.1 hypothetical protein O1G21_36845 [Kitasatospora sp. HUAS 3-15]
MPIGDRWQLLRGGELLGEIVVDDGHFPWLDGRFVPEAGFVEVKPWFDESAALVDAENFQAFERAYDRIDGTLTLVSPHGPVAEFLLHIRGDRASFRWSDEPFSDEA